MKKISADEIDRLFDENEEDILQCFDWETAIRPGQPMQRVNVDFPTWMVRVMDAEATRLGITRQSLIKTWIGVQADRVVHTQQERRARGKAVKSSASTKSGARPSSTKGASASKKKSQPAK